MFRCVVVVVIPLLSLACCPPKQMSGMVYMDIGSKNADGSTHRTELSEWFVVDSTRRLVFADQTLNTDGTGEVKQKVIQDYKTGMQYLLKDNRCFRMNITNEEPGCVPTNATVILKSFVGAGASRIPVTMYSWQTSKETTYTTMADEGCVPVMYESVWATEGGTMKIAAEYFGITSGIPDPSVFTVPSSCIAQNVSVDTGLRRIFISQQMTYDGQNVHQTILQDFASEEQYVTDMNGKCVRTAIDSIEPGCIPQNATIIAHSFIGFGNSKINTTMYRFMQGGSTIYVTMADNGCTPVAYEAVGPTADGGGYQMTIEFFGITPGIVNTAVFQTPHHCPSRIPIFGVGR